PERIERRCLPIKVGQPEIWGRPALLRGRRPARRVQLGREGDHAQAWRPGPAAAAAPAELEEPDAEPDDEDDQRSDAQGGACAGILAPPGRAFIGEGFVCQVQLPEVVSPPTRV